MFKKVLVTFTVSVLISNMQNSLTAILYHLIQTSVKTKKKKRGILHLDMHYSR